MRERKYGTIITLRLTEAQAQELKQKADRAECSMTDILRDALVDRLAEL